MDEIICEELGHISEKEFRELSPDQQWSLVQQASKIISQYRIQADKNCEECEKHLIDINDLNIDLLFEDWRFCKKTCDETDKCPMEERIYMCDLQFNIMNHLAQGLMELKHKLNNVTKILLKRSDVGTQILDEAKKEADAIKRRNESAQTYYQ